MGSSLIAYYSSVILSTVAKPSLVSLLSGVLNIFFALGCVPLYFTVERVGRRSVLLYGAIAMTVLITVFTVLVAVGPGRADVQWASIAIIFLFLFTFGYAWQGCVWLYCAVYHTLSFMARTLLITWCLFSGNRTSGISTHLLWGHRIRRMADDLHHSICRP